MSLNTRTRKVLPSKNILGAKLDSPVYTLPQGCRLVVYVSISKVVGSGAIVVSIQEQHPDTGEFLSLLTSASLAAAGITRLEIGPGIAVTPNVSRNSAIVGAYRVHVDFTGTPPTDGVTFSISAYEPTQA